MKPKLMSEEDFEESITPEVVKPNQLQVMVKEYDLDKEKSQFIIKQFSDHLKLAADWAKKANGIVVTSGTQKEMIKQAREGRLILREKRLEIEKARKFLKEQSLREGQAIDKIANFLKNLIIPTEEHLERQEKFVELKKAAEDAAKRLAIETKLERERLEKEEKDAEERERLRLENDKLRKKIDEETKNKEAELEKIRQIAEAESKRHQAEIDRINKEKEDILYEAQEKERERQQRESEAIEKDRKRTEDVSLGTDFQKLGRLRSDIEAIQIPEVSHYDAVRIIEEVKSHLYLAISRIKPVITEEEF